MGCVERLKAVASCLFLEPAVFLFYISYGIFFVTSQQLYIEKACKVNLNISESVCDNISEHNETQVEAQKLVSTIQGINGSLQSLPTILVAFFAGPLSDRFSRKPLILASLAGYVLLNIIYMVNTYWFYELKMEFLLFECLQDLTGGDLVFMMGINLTIVDSSDTETRTRKIIMIDAFRYAGRALGIQLGAVIKRNYGWRPVFMLNMILLLVTFLYIFFLVKEKKKPAKGSSTGWCEMARGILTSYSKLLAARESRHRPAILGTILALCLFFFQANGAGPFWYLFFRLQYNIDMGQYAHLSVAWCCRSIVANLLILPVLARRFADTHLILLAILTTLLAQILFAAGSTFLFLLNSGFVSAFYWPIEKISTALLSKLVDEHEVGAAFSFLAVISKVLDFLAKPTYGLVYRSTLATYPAAWLLVNFVFLTVMFAIMLWVHTVIRKQKLNSKELETVCQQ